MAEHWDDDLVKTTDESTYINPPRRNPALLAVVAVLIVAGAVAAYLFFRGTPTPTETTAEAPAAAPAPATSTDRALGAEAAPIDLPPLDQSDAIVRELVRQLSTHPQVAAWLATDGLIRNFTVVVTNVAEGKSPAPMLKTLRPTAPFAVRAAGGESEIDPRSYERYASLAGAVASIDPAGAARLYTTLKPRIEEASSELGNPGSFDRTLERALVRLLETPLPGGPLRVKPKGATGYQYQDALLEALPAAQKQLLRMGPDNAAVVQRRLRLIAQALNIPDDRLPPL
jgi:hypothetical protein